MQGKAADRLALARTTGEIEVSSNWFAFVFFRVLVDVRRGGRLVSFLLFCLHCMRIKGQVLHRFKYTMLPMFCRVSMKSLGAVKRFYCFVIIFEYFEVL